MLSGAVGAYGGGSFRHCGADDVGGLPLGRVSSSAEAPLPMGGIGRPSRCLLAEWTNVGSPTGREPQGIWRRMSLSAVQHSASVTLTSVPGDIVLSASSHLRGAPTPR